MPLFDKKQILTDIQNKKLTTLDLSNAFMKDEKAEAKNTATLSGHSDWVCALTVLPDGRLASGSWDQTVKLWDVKSGTCVATLNEHSGGISALTVLPDGRLVSGSFDKTIKLWNVKNDTCVATLRGHGNGINAFTVLPDYRLASGSYDKTIKLWDAKSATCVTTLRDHSHYVSALMVLPDGRLTSGSHDKTIKFWDVKSGACMVTLRGHSDSVRALTALPDGRFASGSYDRTIKLWDVKSGTCVATLSGHSSHVYALTVLPGGHLASGSRYRTLKLWDCGLRPIPWSAVRGVLMQLEHHSTVSKVNLQHTALNDASMAELVTIFHCNQAVTELNLSKTDVTPQGAETFYKSLPRHHPLRQGLRHEAMLSIFCRDVLENFFSHSLINLMLAYALEESPLQRTMAGLSEQQTKADSKDNHQTEFPFTLGTSAKATDTNAKNNGATSAATKQFIF